MKREGHKREVCAALALLLASLALFSVSIGRLECAEALISGKQQARKVRNGRAANYFALDGANVSRRWSPAGQQQQQQPADTPQPQEWVEQQCCACDEAKYELVFEGLWSRYTHPEDFPDNYWLAYFGDIIGASHSDKFRMWALGALASDGVRELAETGATKKLESELKQESAKTRTIIKARELRYPTLNSKTSAVFRTDRQHHLVSVLSKLGPSPDWMLGVSGLELCQADCSWATQRVVNLHLLDAGTDSGATFDAAEQPTRPQERVRYFRKEQPMREARSSGAQQQQQQQRRAAAGYDQVGSPALPVLEENSPSSVAETGGPPTSGLAGEQLKPFARLTITRQRIYEKSCDSAGAAAAAAAPAPAQRAHSNEEAAYTAAAGSQPSTPYALDCRFTDWSDWSACSSQCGKGIRTRTRSFLANDEQAAACQHAELIEKEICLSECVAPSVTCVTRDWSDWSRCSNDCGPGYRRRTRALVTAGPVARACDQLELAEMEPCTGSCTPDEPAPDPCEPTAWSQWSECPVACGRGTMIRVRQLASRENADQCAHVKLIEKQPCMGKWKSCAKLAERACKLGPVRGPCAANISRWHFESSSNTCREFAYGGCLGNKNNFRNIHECFKVCVEARQAPKVPSGQHL